MSKWAQNFTRLGRDGYNLARAVVQHRGTNVKPLLLEHARQSNSVAHSLLSADKEVNLMRYHGFPGYFKQRFQTTSALTTSDGESSTTTSSNATKPQSGAKVAFMVTASMKQELSERLGYDTDQIKSMTPLQASLILNESISPADMESKLPAAEQAYEEQRRKEEEEARIKAEKEQQEIDMVKQQPIAGDSGSTQLFGGGYMSNNELDEVQNSSIGAFFSASEWFEVRETTPDGKTSRVGLYQDKEEAELGLKTRRDIAEAKQTNLKFDLHRIDWKELQA